jgi:hypothetical protein
VVDFKKPVRIGYGPGAGPLVHRGVSWMNYVERLPGLTGNTFTDDAVKNALGKKIFMTPSGDRCMTQRCGTVNNVFAEAPIPVLHRAPAPGGSFYLVLDAWTVDPGTMVRMGTTDDCDDAFYTESPVEVGLLYARLPDLTEWKLREMATVAAPVNEDNGAVTRDIPGSGFSEVISKNRAGRDPSTALIYNDPPDGGYYWDEVVGGETHVKKWPEYRNGGEFNPVGYRIVDGYAHTIVPTTNPYYEYTYSLSGSDYTVNGNVVLTDFFRVERPSTHNSVYFGAYVSDSRYGICGWYCNESVPFECFGAAVVDPPGGGFHILALGMGLARVPFINDWAGRRMAQDTVDQPFYDFSVRINGTTYVIENNSWTAKRDWYNSWVRTGKYYSTTLLDDDYFLYSVSILGDYLGTPHAHYSSKVFIAGVIRSSGEKAQVTVADDGNYLSYYKAATGHVPMTQMMTHPDLGAIYTTGMARLVCATGAGDSAGNRLVTLA